MHQLPHGQPSQCVHREQRAEPTTANKGPTALARSSIQKKTGKIQDWARRMHLSR